MTTPTGEVAFALLYDAWGNLRASTGTPNTRYRFTGAELDPVTGLYHMGARFYDSTLGRWLSEDPVQDKPFEPATLSFYAYVYGNPLLHIDPDGRVPVVASVASAAIGAALGLAAYALATDGQMTWAGAGAAMVAGAVAGATVTGLAPSTTVS
jgi:RHS repeat-associated protein